MDENKNNAFNDIFLKRRALLEQKIIEDTHSRYQRLYDYLDKKLKDTMLQEDSYRKLKERYLTREKEQTEQLISKATKELELNMEKDRILDEITKKQDLILQSIQSELDVNQELIESLKKELELQGKKPEIIRDYNNALEDQKNLLQELNDLKSERRTVENKKTGSLISNLNNINIAKGNSADTNKIDSFVSGLSNSDLLTKDSFNESLKDVVGNASGDLSDTASNLFADLKKSLYSWITSNAEAAMETISKYMGSIDARLQGSGETFDNIQKVLLNTFTGSPYVSQKKLIENVDKLVREGIAYNIEERAALMSLSDRIATTFDALDKNLERLIRLQQADLTASQLGSEASLTKFLNERFQDTSYLSNEYHNVMGTLLEASSLMDVNSATSFLYSAQKWLGSLYSVGLSSNAISTIASGLAALGSGKVSELNKSPEMVRLFGLSAERAGLSLPDMLTSGLDAKTVDKLMTAMVGYLSDIANNTSNKVVKSEWSEILNLSVSDLRAVSNLTSSDISSIGQQSNVNYSESLTELGSQLNQVGKRTSLQTKVDNIVDNIGYNFGMNIAKNEPLYIAWMLTDELDSLASKSGLSNVAAALQKALNWLEVFEFAFPLSNTITQVTNSREADFGLNFKSFGSNPYMNYGRGRRFSPSLDTATAISDVYNQRGSYVMDLGDNYLVVDPNVPWTEFLPFSYNGALGNYWLSKFNPDYEYETAADVAADNMLTLVPKEQVPVNSVTNAVNEDEASKLIEQSQNTPLLVKIQGYDEYMNFISNNMDALVRNTEPSNEIGASMYNIRNS